MERRKPIHNSHVIVTGGAGFIGSRVSAKLLSMGARVTILTRHVSTPRAAELATRGARIIACDLAAQDQKPLLPSPEQADVFLHLAADVSVSGPSVWATNVGGTKRALQWADAFKAPYFVCASSIEAQGLGADQEIPLREEMPCRPVSDYGRSKVKAEELTAAWGAASGHLALILRIGNIYGPGSAWFLHPSLMALLGATPIRRIWSQLCHRRFQPLYIDDLVEGLVRVVESRLTGLYNITGEESVTIGQYLETLARLTQLTDCFELLQSPSQPDAARPLPIAPDFAYALMGTPEQCHRSYDNAKLRAEIGAYGRWSLARGLAATLAWYHASGQLPALLHAIQQRAGALACT